MYRIGRRSLCWFLAALLGLSPLSSFAETVEKRGWRFESGEKNQGRLHLPAESGTREIFEAARAAGVQIRALSPTEESLEDFFMRTIEG